jgi:hypothetical protein
MRAGQTTDVQVSHQRSPRRYNLVGVARLFGLCSCGRERAGEFSAR